jgi:D-3-phosphoglycerate dehydrogenase/C-terminal binding protein
MALGKVIITDYLNDDLQPEREVLQDVADVLALNADSESQLRGRLDDADALMVYHNIALSRDTLTELRRCKVIARVGVGFDNVDGPAARQLGIPIVNVPDYGTEEVADSAIGLTLALARGLVHYNLCCKQPQTPWNYRPAAPLRRLRGSAFAIVGLGRIGMATALRAKALGMDVVFYDPYRDDGYDKAVGVRREQSLAALFRQADVLSFHCPLTPETRHMLNADSLAWLRPGSYVINTARGPIVDTSPLPEALASGRLAGVGLDVLPIEPPLDDDPLVRAWRDPLHAAYYRAIINPHAAFYCEEGLREMRVKAATACRMAVLGQPLRNVVN